MQGRRLDPKVGERLLVSLLSSDFSALCRPETAASVTHLVHRVAANLSGRTSPAGIRIVDMCTGSGCIPLLFHHEFYKRRALRNIALDIRGYDISRDAISLAHKNKALQLERPRNNEQSLSERSRSLLEMKFVYHDLFGSRSSLAPADETAFEQEQQSDPSPAVGRDNLPNTCDILISNPPYVSPTSYIRTTARSVRNFEPPIALVPPATKNGRDHGGSHRREQGDLFYPHLLDLAQRLSTNLVLFEVADMKQATRVVAMVLRRSLWNVNVEIWRDEPYRANVDEVYVDGRKVRVIGEGHGRSVFIRRKDLD